MASKRKKVIEADRRPARKRSRTPEDQEKEQRQIGTLYFVQCQKPQDIAKILGLAMRTVYRQIERVRKYHQVLIEKRREDYLRDVIAGIMERSSERLRKLWNEWIQLTAQIEDAEANGKKNFMRLRVMRMDVLRQIREEDAGLVDRLGRLGLLESKPASDDDKGNEETIMVEIKRRYAERVQASKIDFDMLDKSLGGNGSKEKSARLSLPSGGNGRGGNGDGKR